MREIKFRAWDGQDTMIYFDLDSIKHDGLIDWNEKKYSDTGGGLYIANCKIMQYTGLQDKTGRDIFEGDVVKCKFAFGDNVCEIVYDDDNAGFFVSQKNREIADKAYDNLYWHFEGIEVIGNLYENPELLDK